MLKFFRMLLAKFRSDKGDYILVPALILVPVVALCVGMAIEVSKNNYVRTERVNAIQDAASSAVGEADARGSLNWDVLDRIVDEYEHNRFGGKTFSRSDNDSLHYDSAVRETAESKVFDAPSASDDACLVGSDGTKYPQYTVTLRESRGSTSAEDPTKTFSRTQPAPTWSSFGQLDNKIYRVVEVEVIDQSPNIVLGLIGMPCQKFTLSASAVTFGADTDLG